MNDELLRLADEICNCSANDVANGTLASLATKIYAIAAREQPAQDDTPQYASGGIVTKQAIGLIGERGTETTIRVDAQPAQEAAAWMHSEKPFAVISAQVRDLHLAAKSQHVKNYTIPLYAHPPRAGSVDALRALERELRDEAGDVPPSDNYKYFANRLAALIAEMEKG